MTNASLAEEVEELVAVSLDEYDSGDATWILTSAFIILTMQSGFGLLETGMVSARNEVNIMMKNVVDVVIGGLVYWFLGYGLSHGEPSNAFIGYGDFMISPEVDKEPAFSGYMFSKYLFFFAFASTAATIVSGAVAGRLKFTAYMAFAGLNVVIYALPAHWVWAGNGWLAARGMHDSRATGPCTCSARATGSSAPSCSGRARGASSRAATASTSRARTSRSSSGSSCCGGGGSASTAARPSASRACAG